MAVRTDKQGQIVPANGKQDNSLPTLLQRMGPEIARALPKHVSADRMARIALTALRSTPKLMRCTPESFLGCVIQSAQLGLEVNTPLGHAYLLPFEIRKGPQAGKVICQLIIGYQGMLELARRSGSVKAPYAFAVFERDEFEWELGLNPTLRHKPAQGEDRGQLTHVYAVAKLEGGEPVFTVLTRGEVEKYRKRSRAANDGPWVTDYEAMALKTAIRRLFRWLPKSAEMARAAELDEAPEVGRSQLAAADEQVIGLLQSQGFDTDSEAEGVESEAAEAINPETGEVTELRRPMREPGEE